MTTVTVDRAGLWDAEALSDVAAATFPLACPPGADLDDIEVFLADVLSGERFGEYLSDPSRTVLKAVEDGEIVGYAILHGDTPAEPEIAAAVALDPVLEISKMYVLPGHHGTGVANALMHAALERAQGADYAGIWLGVNQENLRAQAFYAKFGLEKVGTRTFTVGRQVHHDYVLRLAF
ncbi:GNAT family N-acetyltransferase [Nocardia sp. NPDC024068]|uniref:GNAT family N-acetyltransferase n=1 Tax=Nocardia sp. NPDC024068 TaxID=3157197 RepID=UPI0033F69FFF